jgi:alpha-tubulin suppressor-like RCC1 family protein
MPRRAPKPHVAFTLAAAMALGVGGADDGVSPTAPTIEPALAASALAFTQISVGSSAHTCSVASTSAAYCWGSNFLGQLGDGSTVQRLTPVRVAGGLRLQPGERTW